MIHIILTEDDPSVRRRIIDFIQKVHDFELGTVEDPGFPTDIILAGWRAWLSNGPGMLNAYPNVKLVLFDAPNDERSIVAAFRKGANAYLPENTSAQELIFAVRHIHQYAFYLASELSQRLLERVLHLPGLLPVKNLPECDLSSREIEILNLLAQGFTNQEIAEKLFSNKRKIENERQAMLDKSGCRNIIALVRLAMLNDLI